MKIGIMFFLVFVILLIGTITGVFAADLPMQNAADLQKQNTSNLLPEVNNQQSQLELLFYSAPAPLDWSSPTQLVRSTIRNSFAKIDVSVDVSESSSNNFSSEQQRKLVSHPHLISHVNIRLQCRGRAEILTGSTGAQSDFEYISKMLLGVTSMEVMVENTKGKMYTTEQVRSWLPFMRSSGWMHSLSYTISDSLCDYVESYLSAYKQSGQDKIYGGLHEEPLAGIGAGCAAFAISVMKVAGLYDRVFDTWFRRSLKIPHEVMNRPGAPAKYRFLDLYLGNYSRWADASEPHYAVTFWDPQLMYNWAYYLKNGYAHWWRDHDVVMDGKSIVIKVNALNQPTPKSPFRFKTEHIAKIQNEVKRLWSRNQMQ